MYLRGRRFQPAAFALMLATFASGWHRTANHVDWFSTALGILGIVLGVMFAAAWWANRPRWMRWAFLGSTALWVFVAGSSYTIVHSGISALLALAWAILAAGSYWLEASDREEGR